MRSSEAIVVLSEELDECEVDFRAEACFNLDLMIWIVRMDAHIIKLVYAPLIRLRVLSQGKL